MSSMGRRDLIMLLGGAAAWPRGEWAQQERKLPTHRILRGCVCDRSAGQSTMSGVKVGALFSDYTPTRLGSRYSSWEYGRPDRRVQFAIEAAECEAPQLRPFSGFPPA
jgi:hypothetical protein